MLLPTWAFAHGVEVLLTVSILFGSLVLFFLLILAIPLFPAERKRLIAVYLVTIGLTVFLTSLLTYWVHETLVNLLIGLTPVITTVSAYLLMRAKRSVQE